MIRPGADNGNARQTVWRDLGALVLIGLCSLLPCLGQVQDLASREIRHAEIAREIAASGQFLVPTLLGEVYIDKPAILHSVIALCYRLAGEHSLLLARLPSALCAIVGALLLYGIGLTLYGRRTAQLAAAGLLSVVGYWYMARVARPDMLYTMAILLACLGFATLMRAPSRALVNACGVVVAGVGVAVATVSKGPLGLLLPVLFAAIAPYRQAGLHRVSLAQWGLFVVALLLSVSVWLVPAWLQDGGHYITQVLTQPDLDPDSEIKEHALWWYVPHLLTRFLPLTLFLPLLVQHVRRHGMPAMGWLSLVIFVMLSVVTRKRVHYLLPLYPFLALAVAQAVERASQVNWYVGAVAAVLVLSPVYTAISVYRTPAEDADLAVARAVVARTGAATVLCYGTLGEAVAFVGQGQRVLRWGKPEDVPALLQSVGGSAWVVLPDNRREAFTASTGIPVTAAEKLPLPAGQGEHEYYLLYIPE